MATSPQASQVQVGVSLKYRAQKLSRAGRACSGALIVADIALRPHADVDSAASIVMNI
jgi:hypothetical protein